MTGQKSFQSTLMSIWIYTSHLELHPLVVILHFPKTKSWFSGNYHFLKTLWWEILHVQSWQSYLLIFKRFRTNIFHVCSWWFPMCNTTIIDISSLCEAICIHGNMEISLLDFGNTIDCILIAHMCQLMNYGHIPPWHIFLTIACSGAKPYWH